MSRTFVDAIVPDGGRKYSLTANADGTTSIEDVTEYLQVGDRWGAAEANELFATAESAEATAAEAKTTAAAAQATAEEAQSTADSAQSTANTAVTQAAAAQTTADAAMPKSGGTFTGDVVAISTNRTSDCLRNCRVGDSSGTRQSTNLLIFRRK